MQSLHEIVVWIKGIHSPFTLNPDSIFRTAMRVHLCGVG
jgi:hypothetical protein